MSSGIFKALNIEKDEQTIVSVLILQSVFLGIFAGAFDVGAHSLFLKTFDASQIPRAFVVSGLAGIIITSLYTRLQRNMRFSGFALLNLSFVAVSTVLLRLGFEYTESKYLVFLVFVLMGPLTIISFLGFWGNVSRIFSLRQGKRLFGIIDTGQIAGIIISSYAIPVLMRVKFAILDTLFICAGSIFAALIIQLFISRNAQLTVKAATAGKNNAKGSGFMELFKSRYTLLITFFVVFSVITTFFVHYAFISITQENYPEPENLASFLGAFMGTLTVFTVLIKTFLYGRLMKTYGLRLALLLSPVLIGLFSVIILLSGSLYGFTAGASGFIFVFLLLSLSKLFAKSLKDSIEVPSSKILYQALDPQIRYDVQARIDGTVNEISAFFSGLFLAGLGLIAVITLLHYTAVLLVIVILWFFAGALLYKAYNYTLFDALAKSKKSSLSPGDSSALLPAENEDLKTSVLFCSLRLMPQLWNGFFSKKIKTLVDNPNENIRQETQNLIARLGISGKEMHQLFKSGTNQDDDQVAGQTANSGTDETQIISSLSGDRDINLLKEALYSITLSDDKNLHTRLIPFFRDHDPVARASAIRASRNLKNREIVHYLVDILEDSQLYHQAFHAILDIGKPALEPLENAFYKSGISDKGLKRVTKAIAGIKSPEKIPVLTGKLDHYNICVVKEALTGLINEGHSITGHEITKLTVTLQRIVEITARNFSLLVSIRSELPQSDLTQALEEEHKENMNMIFSFLSLAYDPKSVYYIRQNYESGTTEGIGYAVELLDMLIDETIKPFLFPLFEDTSDYDKIKNLQVEYPVDIQRLPDALYSILNSDMNQIGEYSRILAIRELMKHDDLTVTDDIIAQTFHPSKIIRESAVTLIMKADPDLIPGIVKRLDEKIAKDLTTFIDCLKKEDCTGEWKKIMTLRNAETLSFIKRNNLVSLAENAKITDLKKDIDIRIADLFANNEVVLSTEGNFSLKMADGTEIKPENGSLFLTSEVLKFTGDDTLINVKTNATMLKISEDDLREFVFDNEEEGRKLVNSIAEHHENLLNKLIIK